jgi:hypothetical protein
MTLDETQQESKCSLSNVKMTLDKSQNELIKENIKENSKEKNMGMNHPSDDIISYPEEDGTVEHPYIIPLA